MKEKYKLFIPGQRLIRTVMAVFLCMLVYEARSRRGMPVYGTIAAVMCIQPYTGSMAAIARRRIVGTLIGAGWGILFLLFVEGEDDKISVDHLLVCHRIAF